MEGSVDKFLAEGNTAHYLGIDKGRDISAVVVHHAQVKAGQGGKTGQGRIGAGVHLGDHDGAHGVGALHGKGSH